ncbi:septum formation family protein [Luteimicrobium sp. NPDC057192]|uniref:septum formation family protein n=1 Tax=Luteimicrobium sp. NPDC057192 TaxID=3346042 RepID=UPI003640074D
MTSSSARARLFALSLAATAAYGALAGCGLVTAGPPDAARDHPQGAITAAGDADVYSLHVGDCLLSEPGDFDSTATAATEVDSVPVTPCADPHDEEIYAETMLPEGEYPGDDAVGEKADDFCDARFTELTGLEYEDATSLDYTEYTPTEDGWNMDGDRLVQCVLVLPTKVDGSYVDRLHRSASTGGPSTPTGRPTAVATA